MKWEKGKGRWRQKRQTRSFTANTSTPSSKRRTSTTNAKRARTFYGVFLGVYSPKRTRSADSALSNGGCFGTRAAVDDVRAVISHFLGMISHSTTLIRTAGAGVRVWRTQRLCARIVIRPKAIGDASDA